MIDEDNTLIGDFAPDPGKKRLRLDKRNRVKNPKHSHHVGEIAARTDDPEKPQNEAVLIQDGIRVFDWLAEDPTRCMIGQEWVTWCHQMGFTRGYRKQLAELVKAELVFRCEETREEAKARIIIHAQGLYRDARLSGDYGPAVSALKLQKEILLPEEKPKAGGDLHLHMDLSEKPDSELIEMVKRAKLPRTLTP